MEHEYERLEIERATLRTEAAIAQIQQRDKLMALEGNDLFGAQEREGDHIRRMRATPEPEPPRVVVRWLPIYKVIDTGTLFPGNVLFDSYEHARESASMECKGTEFVGIRQVRIEL